MICKTLKREWPLMDLVRVRKDKKLPEVLSVSEVKEILSFILENPLFVNLAFSVKGQKGLNKRQNDFQRLKAGL